MRTSLLHLCALGLFACNSASTEVAPAPLVTEASKLESVRTDLAEGRALDALVTLDELQTSHADDVEYWMLRGNTLLAGAELARDGNFYMDAMMAFEKADELGGGAPALFGATRAARGALEPQRALEFARRALAAETSPTRADLQAAIEATFGAYIAAKQSEQEATPLFDETDALVQRLLATDANDPWALEQLANLYQWEGRHDGALEILSRRIELTPDDESLYSRFVPLKRQLEGPESALSFYESLHARHAESALAPWYAGIEAFELALQPSVEPAVAAERFARAEKLFAACREINRDYTQSCLGYEVMCRAGLGWSKFAADDLDGAERAFLSMEELFPGGMEWQIEGRLRSGVVGLQFVADKALRGGADSFGGFEIGAAARAAEIYARLHAYRPSDGDIANNCGFFHREWGVGTAFKSREYAEQVDRAEDPALRDLNLALSEQARRQAGEILRACRDAYLASARLTPNDVRIVNDAALILVYHFPSQVELAEQLLKQSVEAGRAQKDDPNLGDAQRDSLLEAWADAYQNLGVLHLLLRNDPTQAKSFFETAHEIGPRPRVDREWIRQVALPLCAAAAAGEPLDTLELDPRIFFVE